MVFKNILSHFQRVTGLLLSILLIAGGLHGQSSIFDQLSHREVLSITLEADWTAIDTNRRSDTKFEGWLTFEDEQGKEQRWAVKLINRGNFRRTRCEMAPLKIDFRKKDLRAAGLSEFDDYKLVTHCVANRTEAKHLLQKEYLAYRLYNELTEYSYRVQMLKITYVDVITGDKSKNWGFLIEDTAELKARVGADQSVKNSLYLPRDTFHQNLLKIASLYQYMIGNSDWSLQSGRNVKYIIKEGRVIPVPYDFDFSGLVNASYAMPNPNYKMTSLQTRIFLGFEEDLTELKGIKIYFRNKQDEIFKTIAEMRSLNAFNKETISDYLVSFYDSLAVINPAERISHIATPLKTEPPKGE